MPTKEAGGKCISLDGDADRIVYYFIDNGKLFVLSSSNVLHCSFVILMIFPSRELSKLPQGDINTIVDDLKQK